MILRAILMLGVVCTPAFAAAPMADRLGTLLGRLHQAVVHFPVGLLILAGVIELVSAAFSSSRGRSVSRVCLVLGAFFAVVAAAFGWLNADFDHSGPESATMALHRWGGVAIAGAAGVVALVAIGARGKILTGVARLGTVALAAGVALVGHWGGSLVHGEGHVLAALIRVRPSPQSMPLAPVATPAAPTAAPLPPAAEAILANSSDEGVFLIRRAIRLASLPAAPVVPGTPGPANNEIDRFIAAKWAAAGLAEAATPPETCEDATFCRRVYLDLIGVVPTVEEFNRFLSDARADKRASLIDELLGRHADYADHWTPFWEDALGSSYANLQGGVPTRGNYRRWINDSFKSNKPFDLFAAELIDTSLPGAKKPERASANGKESKIAYIRNETHTDTLQSAAAVAQVFLGTGMKCASCHDHFENKEWPQKRALAYSSLFAPADLELVRCEKHSGEFVPAAFCFDIPGVPKDIPADEEGRLRRVSQLITDPANPRFARAIVNRLWKRYMGLGLVEPADDFRADVPASHPELLDWLAHDLAVHDFDLKRTIRLILGSRTYQHRYQPSLEDHFDIADRAAPRYFRSPSLRRLTAEQVVDSVRLAARQELRREERLFHVNESTALSRALGKPASRNEISTGRADDAAVVQALELLNGEEFSSLVYSAAILDAERPLDVRITSLYKAVLSRPPTPDELAAGREFITSARERAPAPAAPSTTLLLDDDAPAGAGLTGDWKWSDAAAPVAAAVGARFRTQKAEPGKNIQHHARGLGPLAIGPNDKLFVHVWLDPADPPRQIMVQWNDGDSANDGGWAHRAFWGDDVIAYGRPGTASRHRVGDLPALGAWVRLEVSAREVGFRGAGGRLHGLSFDQHGGTVLWDAAGVISSPEHPEVLALGDLMWALVAGPEFQYVK